MVTKSLWKKRKLCYIDCMKAIKLLGISLFIIFSSLSLFAEEGGIETTRQAVFVYYRDTRLADDDFEFYFSIDSCREMVEYIRISYPYQERRQGFGELKASSSNGEITLKLGHAWTIDSKIENGKRYYKGIYDDTIKDLHQSLKFIEILKGEGLELVLSDESGSIMELVADETGLRSIAAEHSFNRDSFSKVW